MIHHDIGKPHCRVVDEGGKVHFPDHARVSRSVWLDAGGDPIVGELIGWDMDFHTANSAEIDEHCRLRWSIRDAMSLMLVAFAEIHSNARLFDADLGMESTSFKMKWKQLDRRGKQVAKFHFPGSFS